MIFLFFFFVFAVVLHRFFFHYNVKFLLLFMSNNLSGKNSLPVSSFIVVYIYMLLILVLLSSFLPYIILVDFISMFKLISYLALSFWWMTFFYLISSERMSLFLCKSGDNLFKCYFLFFIEVLSTMMQPFSLMVRLFVNFMVGFFLLLFFSIFLDSWFNSGFFFLGIFPMLFELGVFFVQSFIFSYLITSYFME